MPSNTTKPVMSWATMTPGAGEPSGLRTTPRTTPNFGASAPPPPPASISRSTLRSAPLKPLPVADPPRFVPTVNGPTGMFSRTYLPSASVHAYPAGPPSMLSTTSAPGTTVVYPVARPADDARDADGAAVVDVDVDVGGGARALDAAGAAADARPLARLDRDRADGDAGDRVAPWPSVVVLPPVLVVHGAEHDAPARRGRRRR